MEVKNGNKVLWHIQNMNILSDGEPYDMFLWSENEPTKEELGQALAEDMDDYTAREMDEWLNTSGIYKVYVSGE